MSEESWTKNPALGGIDPSKLQMLLALSEQAKGKSSSELLPFLMATASQPKENRISFSSSETDAIIEVLKAGKSPEEIRKIDRLCAIMKQLKQK